MKNKTFAPCTVCNTRGNGIHFGVDACRGCTSFFRRTVVQNRKYLCNQDESCDIGNTGGVACRKCRFDKCLEVGMKKEAIQMNRDVYGKRKDDFRVTSIIPSPSTFRLSFPVPSPLLKAIGSNYSQLENVRIVIHHEGTSMFKERISQAVNYKQANNLMMREFHLVSDWISASFPQLAELELDQKNLLIRNFYLKFYILECGFIACQKGRNNVFFLPNGDYIDCQNLTSYYTDPEGKQPITPEEAAKMFGSACSLYRRNVTSPMLKENVDKFEFLALAALVLFDSGLDNQTEKCIEICSKIRQTVQREMLQYYSTRQVDEFCIRMGNLLSLLPNLQKATDRMQKDIEMSRLFNCYSPDDNFFDNFPAAQF